MDYLEKYLINDIAENPWKNTILADYYALSPVSKGSKAEEFVAKVLTDMGYKVERRRSTGHDRIINGKRTEIKFALATKRNYDYECIFNHIGLKKDWENIIFCCVNGDLTIRMVMFTRDTFPFEVFNTQQGGKSSGNDDYMTSGTRSKELLFHKDATVLMRGI